MPGPLRDRAASQANAERRRQLLHRAALVRLGLERFGSDLRFRRRSPRVISTACWRFPIYSQTFVYQELTQLTKRGYDLRFLYSELETDSELPEQFAPIWRGRRKLYFNELAYADDFQHFRTRMPDKVGELIDLLCSESGIGEGELLERDHFKQSFSFARVVQAFRPSYIHSYFFYEGSLFAFVAAFLLGIPRGVSCYSDHLLDDYDLKLVALQVRSCDLVIATSRRIKAELLDISPEADADRILVKPNAINSRQFPVMERAEPADGEPFRLLCVARFDPKKGLEFLVSALDILRQRGVEVELHLVGSVDPDNAPSVKYASDLESHIRALNLDRYVHLEGHRPEAEVNEFLGRSHVFVAPFVELPSGDKDGIPTTVLEAMATGIAVVATDAGSITEIIENGKDGVVVAQRDPRALADAIESLLDDVDSRRRLGSRAAENVRARFDAAVCEDSFDAALTEILNGRGS